MTCAAHSGVYKLINFDLFKIEDPTFFSRGEFVFIFLFSATFSLFVEAKETETNMIRATSRKKVFFMGTPCDKVSSVDFPFHGRGHPPVF
ncbi:MAG: hypothetical protein KKC21_00765 [Nitrospinae bacterium]|nr:hypothetical protein [Nitrospinota bacterium]